LGTFSTSRDLGVLSHLTKTFIAARHVQKEVAQNAILYATSHPYYPLLWYMNSVYPTPHTPHGLSLLLLLHILAPPISSNITLPLDFLADENASVFSSLAVQASMLEERKFVFGSWPLESAARVEAAEECCERTSRR